MVTEQEIQSYKIPGLKPLTTKQLGFFVDVMNGSTLVDAYKKNYGYTRGKEGKVEAYAWQISKSHWFQQYKEHYEKLIAERKNQEIVWNRDLAIQERRRLYSLNLSEVERLSGAYKVEIEYYTKKKLEAIEQDDEKKVEEYERKIIRATKAHNMSVASNAACQQALDGLDKLCGLQTLNMNHTGNVNFFGDDMWNDEYDESEQNEEH